jgi:hypothetical protein
MWCVPLMKNTLEMNILLLTTHLIPSSFSLSNEKAFKFFLFAGGGGRMSFHTVALVKTESGCEEKKGFLSKRETRAKMSLREKKFPLLSDFPSSFVCAC